jgi:hypothetical protein
MDVSHSSGTSLVLQLSRFGTIPHRKTFTFLLPSGLYFGLSGFRFPLNFGVIVEKDFIQIRSARGATTVALGAAWGVGIAIGDASPEPIASEYRQQPRCDGTGHFHKRSIPRNSEQSSVIPSFKIEARIQPWLSGGKVAPMEAFQ